MINTLKSIISETTYARKPEYTYFFYFECRERCGSARLRGASLKLNFLVNGKSAHRDNALHPFEKAETEKISPEKWQSVLRARGRWIFSVVTRAAQRERATFLVADFGGFVVHPFPSLPPSVHYLNKQAREATGEIGCCLYTISPTFSVSL